MVILLVNHQGRIILIKCLQLLSGYCSTQIIGKQSSKVHENFRIYYYNCKTIAILPRTGQVQLQYIIERKQNVCCSHTKGNCFVYLSVCITKNRCVHIIQELVTCQMDEHTQEVSKLKKPKPNLKLVVLSLLILAYHTKQ